MNKDQPNWVVEYNHFTDLHRKITNRNKITFSHLPKETISLPYQSKFPDVICTYVVFDRKTLLTKIGRSTNYELRIRKLEIELGTSLMLIKVFPGDIEKELHLIFYDYRHTGEWFNLTSDQLDAL